MTPTPSVELTLASAGSYPHSGPSDDLQVLVQARAAVARGEKTAADLSDAENFMVRRAIEDQLAAGFERVTDGLTRWLDPVSHVACRLEGVSPGASRSLPSGVSYRVPMVNKRPFRRVPVVADEYRFACNALGALGTPSGKAGKLSVKAVLTGPFTLAKLSEASDPSMSALEARAEAFSTALAAEVAALAECGAEQIQIDEPAPFEPSTEWVLLRTGLSALAAARDVARKTGRRVELQLSLNSAGAPAHYGALFELPIDVIMLDLAHDAEFLKHVMSSGVPKPVHLGLVSGRVPEMEDEKHLARTLELVLTKLPAGRSFLGPAGGLGSLTREAARAKLELVARLRDSVLGKSIPQ